MNMESQPNKEISKDDAMKELAMIEQLMMQGGSVEGERNDIGKIRTALEKNSITPKEAIESARKLEGSRQGR